MATKTDEWEYRVDNGEVTLTKYLKGKSSEIKMPNEIEGHPVTGLGARLLKGRKALKNVALPKGLKCIDYEAFCGCENLAIRSTDLSKTLVNISSMAFWGCKLVGDTPTLDDDTMFTFPPSCEYIGPNAFARCSGETRLVLPPTIKETVGSAFLDSNLIYVRCECDISTNMFRNCKQLEKAIISKDVEHRAFELCSKLKIVELKKGVTAIGNYSFAKTAIESVTFPKSTKTISAFAFSNCEKLKRVSFAGIVPSIHKNAFLYTRIEDVILPPEIQKAVDSGEKLNEKQIAFLKTLADSGLKSYSVLMALAATV